LKAIAQGVVVADAGSAEVIHIEGNAYFPLSAVTGGRLQDSARPYRCPWKGVAQYYDVIVDGQVLKDAAWGYPNPLPSAVSRVGRDFSQHVAFDPGQVAVRS
jgi:uncharacterized protein (DUF427 family)